MLQDSCSAGACRRTVGGLTEAGLGDVIPAHGHHMLPGGGGRSGGRRLGPADGGGELAHGPVHHPSERLHRHVSTCCSVRVVTASAHARWGGSSRILRDAEAERSFTCCRVKHTTCLLQPRNMRDMGKYFI